MEPFVKYTREEILNKKMKFRNGFIKLKYGYHAEQRLDERLSGSLLVKPSIVNITEKNIYSGMSDDNENLKEVVVRIEYKKADWCFMAIILKTGFVKTVYFKKKGEWNLKNKIKEENEKSI
jgi:hypothetical protein